MNDRVNYNPKICYTRNTEMLDEASLIAFYDFPGEMSVNRKKCRITFLTPESEMALPELTGRIE